jgi:hypothetical protein
MNDVPFGRLRPTRQWKVPESVVLNQRLGPASDVERSARIRPATLNQWQQQRPHQGCAHWGQMEPSAQLRLSPLGATRLIVGPLPHARSCTFVIRIKLLDVKFEIECQF